MNKQTITPYLFEGFLIISLEQKWIEKFGTIPSFVVYVDDNQQLHMVSKESIKDA
jgi:hypothetical protein